MNEHAAAAKAENDNTENKTSSGERTEHRRHHRKRSRSNQQQQRGPEASLNLNELREVAELIDKHGFTDFEFENENIRIRLRRELAPQIVPAQPMMTTAIQPQPAPVTQPEMTKIETPHLGAKAEKEAAADEDLYKITSPIVGTFYHAPSPEADPFVKIGDNVTAETVVCIIEAMKLMNEIQAETSGKVVKIYVENGQPVEYGQPLFGIKK
jgi:acetyl-CoA carboxylase biotin carboxyl carrier protein